MQPTISLPRYIVDASIVIKWHLRDEEFMAEAQVLLDAFREDRVALLAPDHLRYEVANALRTAVRTRRISPSDGQAGIAEFFSWKIPTVGSDRLILAGYDAALRYDCALYDGLYLALAQRAQCSFIHADRRLRNALSGRFPRELWIEGYRAGEA